MKLLGHYHLYLLFLMGVSGYRVKISSISSKSFALGFSGGKTQKLFAFVKKMAENMEM